MTEVEELEAKLEQLRNENLSAWNMYGSELCADEMIRKETELENRIKELKSEQNGK